MKALNAKIDWMERYANDPHLMLLVDHIPSLEEMRFDQLLSLYFAELDGYVSFFSYSQPDKGYGGRTFTLQMTDGSTKTLIGPWSSNPAAMEYAGFTPSIDCSLTDDPSAWEKGFNFFAGHCTITFAEQAITTFCPEAQLLHYSTKETPLYLQGLSSDQALAAGGTSQKHLIVLKDGHYKPNRTTTWK